MMQRRRFLTVSAAFACAPHIAQASVWRGRAFGAEVSVSLEGPRDRVAQALAEVAETVHRMEQHFTLHDPTSELSRLNRDGWLRPSPVFADLVMAADEAHHLTDGLFDPTVQALWLALQDGAPREDAQGRVGWHRVRRHDGVLRMDRDQHLTFNGIAQGFATDRLTEHLGSAGFDKVLVNIGEHAALGGPFRIGLVDPQQGYLGDRVLQNGAIATSSPFGTRVNGAPHIMAPGGQAPLWSTISIEAPSATMADALSTAAVFMDRASLERLKHAAPVTQIIAVNTNGRLITI